MFRRLFLRLAVTVPLGLVLVSLLWRPALWAFVVVGPLLALGLHDIIQRRRSLLRIYPIIGHGRFLMESIRPEIQQYFVESNTDGRPFSREKRSVVYQRAKGVTDTTPFGTQRDVGAVGYEWMSHSLAPQIPPPSEPRVHFGGPECSQPYDASHLNISAMSFGSLSRNAITALNRGARAGDFYHNTGEGGLSPYHLDAGADVVWQIGTAYFGCRSADGGFDAGAFAEKSRGETVKMIEIKLSQGAKPGHGGILPAAKLTPEIAAIRGVPLGQDVLSPPAHSAFEGPKGLLEFTARLRELSGGKPVGFKLCVGYRSELFSICKAMLETGIRPDFITVDGAEGGTGAAPLEFSNAVGMPLREGLTLVDDALRGIGARQDVRVIAAGMVATGFDMICAMALGADICNAARTMMLALGCIQARRCHTNDCPVGVATQDPMRNQGLDIDDKARRVERFHGATIHSFLELLATAGLSRSGELQRHHVFRRVSQTKVATLAELFPPLAEGCLLHRDAIPAHWRSDWERATADSWGGAVPSTPSPQGAPQPGASALPVAPSERA